jgi:peptide/nickel transport system substrate-binding protein
MVKNIVGAGARVLHTICFPSQFGCTDEGAPRYSYDPALAKRLLAEAGFPNGFDTEIFAYRERNQTEAMIGNLQAVGIRAKLTFSQYAAMRDQVRANKSALSHQTWGSFSVNDMSASTPVYFTFQADDISRDPEVRDLLLRGDNSVNPEVRKNSYRDALRLIAERMYAVPLWSLPVYYVASKDLTFSPYPDEMVRFWEMSWK